MGSSELQCVSRICGDDIVSSLWKYKENGVAIRPKDKRFEMTLNVLRSTNEDGKNEMMKLIRYSIASSSSSSAANDYGSLASGSVG